MKRLLVFGVLLAGSCQAWACEPVLPFVQTVIPTSLSGSLIMLTVAVVVKSVLFACFERRLSLVRAGSLMLLGNVLTTVVGALVAGMIGSGGLWPVGLPLVFFLCWLPSRRLVGTTVPLGWLKCATPAGLAAIMTMALMGSCILFMMGRGAIEANCLAEYWIIKLLAVFLALLASMSLTTIWEEWVIWRFSSRTNGSGFYASALRANLYVMVLIMAMPAAVILPKRLKSPNFLARHTNTVTSARAR